MNFYLLSFLKTNKTVNKTFQFPVEVESHLRNHNTLVSEAPFFF